MLDDTDEDPWSEYYWTPPLSILVDPCGCGTDLPGKASSNMLTAGAVAPAVKPPALAVESKLWHWGGGGGQTVSSYLLKRVFLTLADE